MIVLWETPELPVLSWAGGVDSVALGVDGTVSLITTWLVMVTTTPFCVVSILVWLVDGRTIKDVEGEGEVEVSLVEVGLDC